jgi:hypothetical protein
MIGFSINSNLKLSANVQRCAQLFLQVVGCFNLLKEIMVEKPVNIGIFHI